jgi:hypothetical protein
MGLEPADQRLRSDTQLGGAGDGVNIETDAIRILRELLRLSPAQRSEPEFVDRIRAIVARADARDAEDRVDTSCLAQYRQMLRKLDLPDHLKEKA